MKEEKYISWNLILRKMAGRLSPEEEQEFQSWIAEDIRHREYFEKALKSWNEPEEEKQPDLEKLIARFDQFASQTPPKPHPGFKLKSYLPYAAAFLLPVAVALAVFLLPGRNIPVPQVATLTEQIPITPGGNHASIILANGQQVLLDGNNDSLLQSQGGSTIIQKEGIISYQGGKKTQEEEFNSIVIPRGGEYCLELSDGTKVWLNSSSTLRYPVNFVGHQRIVELDGEAFFEVSPDKNKPFIVKTNQVDVKVYGTAFNVYAYSEEQVQHTTLQQGQVGIIRDGKEYKLKPGQQAKSQNNTSGISITKVNTALYCSWHTGKLLLENEKLEDILNRLSRWYNVDFSYTDNTLRNLHFSGDLERYADFSEILDLIKMTTSVEFVIQGRQVTVKPE